MVGCWKFGGTLEVDGTGGFESPSSVNDAEAAALERDAGRFFPNSKPLIGIPSVFDCSAEYSMVLRSHRVQHNL